MITINNAYLNVAVLDPIADQARFGARYCTGGYIYQITDQRCGDLLSGPTYPNAFNWFDGQGFPDSFRTHLSDPTNKDNPQELGIGIGLINRSDNAVLEFCKWEVTDDRDTVRFATKQSFQGWSFELTRVLSLMRRTLRSSTRMKSTSGDVIPIFWFPHPFFPHYESGECCKCNIDITVSDGPGFEMLPNGFIGQKGLPWDRRGHFLELSFKQGQPLEVLQKHPKLGLVAASFSYSPSYFPIWGNRNTFSFEPYLKYDVAANEELEWVVSYDL
jgi:hypothetical protein